MHKELVLADEVSLKHIFVLICPLFCHLTWYSPCLKASVQVLQELLGSVFGNYWSLEAFKGEALKAVIN